MDRTEFARKIKQRLKDEYGLELTLEQVKAFLKIEEDEVYTAIAMNDSIAYMWGTISGEEKPPRRMSGKITQNQAIINNYGFSSWKSGYPNCKFSKAALLCEKKTPEEYFSQDDIKYTSEARIYRQAASLPELPEFEGLTEEEIKEINRRADKAKFEELPKNVQTRKKIDRAKHDRENLIMRKYWKDVGYIPQGVLYFEHYGKHNYTGPQRDSIDTFLEEEYFSEECNYDTPERLDKLRDVIDYAILRDLLDAHPELIEMEAKYRKEIEEQGLEQKPHYIKIQREYIPNNAFKYKGEADNDDAWGIKISKEDRDEQINSLREYIKSEYEKRGLSFVQTLESDVQRYRSLDFELKKQLKRTQKVIDWLDGET